MAHISVIASDPECPKGVSKEERGNLIPLKVEIASALSLLAMTGELNVELLF